MTTNDLRMSQPSALVAVARPKSVLRSETRISAGFTGVRTAVTAPTYRTFTTAPCSAHAARLTTNTWSPNVHAAKAIAMAKRDRWPLPSTS